MRISRAAFQQLNPNSQAGQFGNEGRNVVRGPGIENVDLSIFKNFRLTETARLQFRAECFNLFNHTQVWGINTGFGGDNPGSGISATNANFGQASSWRDARTLQLALRFAF